MTKEPYIKGQEHKGYICILRRLGIKDGMGATDEKDIMTRAAVLMAESHALASDVYGPNANWYLPIRIGRSDSPCPASMAASTFSGAVDEEDLAI